MKALVRSVLLGLLLWGCGSSPGGPTLPPIPPVPPPPPPPPSGQPTITVEQRMATLDAVANKLARLAAPNPDSRRQELLSYLESRTEFEDAGINEDGSLWARFTDGRLLLFPIAMVLDETGGAPGPPLSRAYDLQTIVTSGNRPRAAGPPAELPTSVQARFLSGGDPPGTPTSIPFLQGLVTSRGYRIAPNAGIGTIDDLLRVSGDGIFYFGGHGGPGYTRDGGRAYGVTTATKISAANDIQYQALWNDGSLAYGFPITNLLMPYASTVPPGTWPSGQRPEDYYAFTAKFVKDHMGGTTGKIFSDGSLVYLASCTSFDPGFRDAFIAKGAGVYFGWTNLTGPLTDGMASGFLFDRMLGTNTSTWPTNFTLSKENPEQRPFDYLSVYNNMVSKNMVSFRSQYGTAVLNYWDGNTESGLLAPSIQYMDMYEAGGGSKDFGMLILIGKFGTDPGEVKIGGVNLTIDSWEKEEIRAIIPVSGPQSAGDVEVWSKGRKSNPRRLTDWRPTFRFAFDPPGQNTFKYEGELRLHFRADVSSYREESGKPPKYRPVPFYLAGDSFGELEASGEGPIPRDPQVTPTFWEGVAPISNRIALESQNLMDGIGEFETETPALRLAFFLIVQEGMWVVQGPSRVRLQSVWALNEAALQYATPGLPAMSINVNRNFAIQGDLKRLPEPVSPELFWATYSPQYPPKDDLARSPIALKSRAALKPAIRPDR